MTDLLAKRFRVLSELGRGGMGTVYRVADTLNGDREVALKTIQLKGTVTAEMQLRFKEEFRSMVKLKHPNTIEVFDYGQLDDQTQFITMEIVPGEELGQLIARNDLTLEKTYHLLVQLLQALGFIHSRLYVHRDIKAENIRVKDDGTLKLMDFGLMDQLGTPTNGKLTGTPSYLPPEVGKGGVINASSDLYSVGCLAYEMITGRLPFVGTMLEVIRGHINEAPIRLSELRPDVPERLEALVMRLLEKDQMLRYHQASEVIEDLADLAGLNVSRVNLEQKKSYLTSSVLVGRDRELQELEASLGKVKAGEGQAAFVGAPAGIGKSRLVQELVLQAKLSDLPVLHGQCLESGMTSYEPLAQALRSVISLSTPEELQTYGPVLLKILPELSAQGIQPAEALSASLEKIRLNETIVSWLKDVTVRTPVVLFFDDLHWCDPSSLETFNHCIRHLDEGRVFYMGTFRNDEAPVGSPLWFTIDEGLTHYLKLSAFNLPQMMLLIRAMLHDVAISKEFSEFLFDATSGNAFFVTEVLRYLMEEGVLTQKEGQWHFPSEVGNLVLPTSVEATVLRRLSQLSDQALAIARIASVLGRYQERDMLLAVSGLDEDSLFAGIDELIERQFILKDESRYTFPHDRVREALYASIPTEELESIHERCGTFLEKKTEDRNAIINELAYHFSRSAHHEKAFEYLVAAGHQNNKAGVFGVAIQLWKKAASLLETLDIPFKETQQIELLLDLAWTAVQASPLLAVETYLKVIPMLEAHEEQYRAKIIHSYSYLGACYGRAGQPIKGLECLEHARKLLPQPGMPQEGVILVASAVALNPAGHYDEVARFTKAVEAVLTDENSLGNPGLRVAWVASIALNLCVGFQGINPGEHYLDRSIQCAIDNRDYPLLNTYWSRYAVWTAWTGRYEKATEIVELMTQNSRRIGAPPFPWTIYLRLNLLWQKGEFEEAQALLQQALRYPHINDDTHAQESIYVMKGHILLSLGEIDEAETSFKDLLTKSREGQLNLITIQALIGLGQLEITRKSWVTARQYLQEAYDMAAAGKARNPLHEAIAARHLAEVALGEGDLAQAQSYLELAQRIVESPEQDNHVEQGHVYRTFGELHLVREDKEAALAAFHKAHDQFQNIHNRYLARRVARQLDALRDPDPSGTVARVVPENSNTRRSTLNSLWQESLVRTSQPGTSPHQFLQTCLSTVSENLRADEASVFLVDSTIRWAASRNKTGACSRTATNHAFLEQVRSEQKGLVAIDLPEQMAISTGSNFETEFPSVAVAPVVIDGQPRALVYLLRRSIVDPFMPEDLDSLGDFCAEMSRHLQLETNRTLLFASRISNLSEDLKSTLRDKSQSNLSHQDLLQTLMLECADRLNVDEISLLVHQAEADWTTYHSNYTTPSVINMDLVSKVVETGTSLCAIDLPADFGEGSRLDVEMPSVVVSPLLDTSYKAVVYCIRRNLEAPLNEEDLPAVEVCAQILGEALNVSSHLRV